MEVEFAKSSKSMVVLFQQVMELIAGWSAMGHPENLITGG